MDDKFYELHNVPDPSKPYIFHEDSYGCLPHWHENIELLYFHSHAVIFCDRTEYTFHDGDIAIIGPDVLHAIPYEPGLLYDCLIVDRKFCVDNDVDTGGLKFVCGISDKTAEKLYIAAEKEITSENRFSEAGAKAALLSLVVYLCRNYSRTDIGVKSRNESIKQAIGYINSKLDTRLSVDEIASCVSLSKYYFCREFHKETGFTVVEYINLTRCHEAEKLLMSGKYTVSEVANMCGYENLSYFSRTFKKVIGVLPGSYKKASLL